MYTPTRNIYFEFLKYRVLLARACIVFIWESELAEILFEFAEIIGRRDENFSIWTRQPAYRDEVKQALPV